MLGLLVGLSLAVVILFLGWRSREHLCRRRGFTWAVAWRWWGRASSGGDSEALLSHPFTIVNRLDDFLDEDEEPVFV